MKLLHVHIRGWTATFRLPLLYSGTGLSSPVPPYSTLLGLMGALAGREIFPHETRIGFMFKSEGVAIDIERTTRLKLNRASGRLVEHPERGIAYRQFLVMPQLDLFLDNLAFEKIFQEPQNPLCLGRSQDVAWIEKVKVIIAEPVSAGKVRGTLLPFPQTGVSGQILVLPDYFNNRTRGYTRTVGKLQPYFAVKFATPSIVENVQQGELVKVESHEEAIYLHNLMSNHAN